MSNYEQDEAKRAGFDDGWERLWWRHRYLEDDTIVPTACIWFVIACLALIWSNWT
jgi:hypothetical protein